MRIGVKGQVAIPKRLRDLAGLTPGTRVSVELDGDGVRIRGILRMGRGAALIARMKGRGDITLSTDQIMALTRK